jgi:hypothetical protein
MGSLDSSPHPCLRRGISTPASWQVTATTILCDFVDEFATVIVNQDWSCKCTWWAKYKMVKGEDPKHKLSKEVARKTGKCRGPDCRYVITYRDKLMMDEKSAKK